MSTYVTQQAWLQTRGRPDAIDEIADQFERPDPAAAPPGPIADSPDVVEARWPRPARGWRSAGRFHASGRLTPN